MSTPLVLDIARVGAVLDATIEGGDPHRPIDGYAIDSRVTRRGDLFFAIRGERLDGHAFVADAVAAGAVAVVVSDERCQVADARVAVLRVPDTTRALQALGRYVRRESGALVVAITGSAGKTTTKEIAADLIALRFRTYRSHGNFNNHIGLPLSLLDLRSKPEVAVLELGMNHAGELRQLVGLAEPDLRAWTNVGDAHLGHFASTDALADAKAEILEGGTPDQHLVANADDPYVMARVGRWAGRLTTFGESEGATFRVMAVRHRGTRGMEADVRTPAGDTSFTTTLLGRANVANIVAAMAIAAACGVPVAAMSERIAMMRAPSHRGEVVTMRGVTLIDDAYNSNPQALCQAVETLARETGALRRVAVIGEMLELGAHAVPLHQRCGEELARAGVGLLVTVGGDAARALGARARAAGMPASHVAHVRTAEEAAELVVEQVRPGDVMLVKGSRGVRLERVVERLRERFV